MVAAVGRVRSTPAVLFFLFAAAAAVTGCGNKPHLVGARDPRIEVTPSSMSFRTPVGTSTSGDLVVTNVGHEPLIVGLSQMNPAGEFDLDPSALPVTIQPGEHVSMAVIFHPDIAGTSDAALSLGSDDPITPNATVALEGKGLVHHTETFTQGAAGNEADILVLLDEDLGLDNHTEYEGGLDALMHWLQQDHVDYHLGVTGASTQNYGGKLVAGTGAPTVIDPSTPSPSAALLANADVVGASTEMDSGGFAGALDALSPTELASDNAGFLRPEAFLDLVWMTDEDDTSPATVLSYRNAYIAVKNTAAKVAFAAISEPGSRYQQMASTPAAFGSFDDPSSWDGVMQTLAASASGMSGVFGLAYPVDPSTITVTVDGLVYPTPLTWTYDSAAHAIRFVPTYLPDAGSTIVVDYGEP